MKDILELGILEEIHNALKTKKELDQPKLKPLQPGDFSIGEVLNEVEKVLYDLAFQKDKIHKKMHRQMESEGKGVRTHAHIVIHHDQKILDMLLTQSLVERLPFEKVESYDGFAVREGYIIVGLKQVKEGPFINPLVELMMRDFMNIE